MNMAKRNTSIGALAAIGAAVALAAVPVGADAQAVNTRMGWQPFLGCWQADGVEEDLGILCFAADGGQVEMLTIADGAITHREPFPVDGRTRSIEQDECVGTESARFSDDQRRIYTASEVSCPGQAPRRGTGIIFMPSAGEWVDVRSSQADDEEAMAWAQWYVRTDEGPLNELGIRSGRDTGPLAVRGVASFTMAPITIDDVVDAWEHVDEKAVEAWVAEVGQEFAGLDSEDLLQLDAAGVSGNVIDVVVAVSFPERFALQEDDRRRYPATYGRMGPMWVDPYYYGYSRYGYNSGWYSPYGGYWGGYGSYYPYRTVIVDVTPIPRTTGGRVVSGRGYSRGWSGPSSTIDTSSGGRSSSVSPPSSSGGSSRSTGRTAKPRRSGGSGK